MSHAAQIVRTTKIVTLARGFVQEVTFTPSKGKVTARCKGLPTITVKQELDNRVNDRFVASINIGADMPFCVSAKTPERAFSRAVKNLWAL